MSTCVCVAVEARSYLSKSILTKTRICVIGTWRSAWNSCCSGLGFHFWRHLWRDDKNNPFTMVIHRTSSFSSNNWENYSTPGYSGGAMDFCSVHLYSNMVLQRGKTYTSDNNKDSFARLWKRPWRGLIIHHDPARSGLLSYMQQHCSGLYTIEYFVYCIIITDSRRGGKAQYTDTMCK